MTVLAFILKYRAPFAVALLVLILIGGVLSYGHSEKRAGEAVTVAVDTKASAVVEKQAEKETEANAVRAGVAAIGARSAQNAVDTYIAAHPVGSFSLPDPARDRGTGVCQERTPDARAHDPGAGPAVVPAVLGGEQDVDQGPAVATILRAAARLAVVERERENR